MNIIEIFTNELPVVHWSNSNLVHMGVFEINDMQYIIQFIKVTPNDYIHAELPNEILTNHTWFFAFAAIIDDHLVDSDTNKGDSIKIFNVIVNTLTQFVKDKQIDVLYLGCSDKHLKRKKLYHKLVLKYTQQFNWTIDNVVTGNFFDDVKYLWILKKSSNITTTVK